MEGELNFLQAAKKTLIEDKGSYSADFSRWVSSWQDSVEYYFGNKPLKPPPEVELVEHTGYPRVARRKARNDRGS